MNGVSCRPLYLHGRRCDDGFRPAYRKPEELPLGAAAQFGIYGAYFMAIFLGFNDKAAAAISIIGGADG